MLYWYWHQPHTEPGIHSYQPGTVVDLSATPDEALGFQPLERRCYGTSPTITVTMDTNKDVIANFTLPRDNPDCAIKQDPGIL